MINMLALAPPAVAGGRGGRHPVCVSPLWEAACCSQQHRRKIWDAPFCSGRGRWSSVPLLKAIVLVSPQNLSVQQLVVPGVNSSRFAE